MSSRERDSVLARWERPDNNAGRGEQTDGPPRAVVVVFYLTPPEYVSDEKIIEKLYATAGLKRGTWPNWLDHVDVEEIYDPDEDA